METDSKLLLVDLAGSERPSKTGAQGTRFEEGKQINLSLMYLARVIKTLSEGQGGYVPYRDSKLTHILKDSLGGNSRTTMIAAIAPGEDDRPETISTLRYAKQASLIQNVAEINRNPTAWLIEQLKKEPTAENDTKLALMERQLVSLMKLNAVVQHADT